MGRFSLVACLLLAGCATPAPYLATCPPLKAYSHEFQRQAADQLEALPAGSPVVRLVTDYIALRKAVKDCAR